MELRRSRVWAEDVVERRSFRKRALIAKGNKLKIWLASTLKFQSRMNLLAKRGATSEIFSNEIKDF